MDKEQVILQRLEQLHLEQLKALKELKKVEKTKKKRRRTAHGHSLKHEYRDHMKNSPRSPKSASTEGLLNAVTTPDNLPRSSAPSSAAPRCRVISSTAVVKDNLNCATLSRTDGSFTSAATSFTGGKDVMDTPFNGTDQQADLTIPASIIENKSMNTSNTGYSSQIEEQFPKPDDRSLNANDISLDFLLPDKDYAMSKPEKLKQVRELGMSMSVQPKLSISELTESRKKDCIKSIVGKAKTMHCHENREASVKLKQRDHAGKEFRHKSKAENKHVKRGPKQSEQRDIIEANVGDTSLRKSRGDAGAKLVLSSAELTGKREIGEKKSEIKQVTDVILRATEINLIHQKNVVEPSVGGTNSRQLREKKSDEPKSAKTELKLIQEERHSNHEGLQRRVTSTGLANVRQEIAEPTPCNTELKDGTKFSLNEIHDAGNLKQMRPKNFVELDLGATESRRDQQETGQAKRVKTEVKHVRQEGSCKTELRKNRENENQYKVDSTEMLQTRQNDVAEYRLCNTEAKDKNFWQNKCSDLKIGNDERKQVLMKETAEASNCNIELKQIEPKGAATLSRGCTEPMNFEQNQSGESKASNNKTVQTSPDNGAYLALGGTKSKQTWQKGSAEYKDSIGELEHVGQNNDKLGDTESKQTCQEGSEPKHNNSGLKQIAPQEAVELGHVSAIPKDIIQNDGAQPRAKNNEPKQSIKERKRVHSAIYETEWKRTGEKEDGNGVQRKDGEANFTNTKLRQNRVETSKCEHGCINGNTDFTECTGGNGDLNDSVRLSKIRRCKNNDSDAEVTVNQSTSKSSKPAEVMLRGFSSPCATLLEDCSQKSINHDVTAECNSCEFKNTVDLARRKRDNEEICSRSENVGRQLTSNLKQQKKNPPGKNEQVLSNFDEFSQNMFSQRLLETLGMEQDFLHTQKACDEDASKHMDRKDTSNDESKTGNDAIQTSQSEYQSEFKTCKSEFEKDESTGQISLEKPDFGDIRFDDLSLVDEPYIASRAIPPLANEVPSEEHSGQYYQTTPEIVEHCLQHVSSLPWSSNNVLSIKFLNLSAGDTKLLLVAVCMPKLLVLWKSVAHGSTWTVLHRWILEEEEEFLDLEMTSVDSCIVILTGGKFSKGLGRVYCVLDRGDWNFDVCKEVSFLNIRESTREFKCMCLLPKRSAESVNIVLASTCGSKIVLTNWTIDLLCLCVNINLLKYILGYLQVVLELYSFNHKDTAIEFLSC